MLLVSCRLRLFVHRRNVVFYHLTVPFYVNSFPIVLASASWFFSFPISCSCSHVRSSRVFCDFGCIVICSAVRHCPFALWSRYRVAFAAACWRVAALCHAFLFSFLCWSGIWLSVHTSLACICLFFGLVIFARFVTVSQGNRPCLWVSISNVASLSMTVFASDAVMLSAFSRAPFQRQSLFRCRNEVESVLFLSRFLFHARLLVFSFACVFAHSGQAMR